MIPYAGRGLIVRVGAMAYLTDHTLSGREVAEALGVGLRAVNRMLHTFHAKGLIYVEQWRGELDSLGRHLWVPCYRAGDLPDSPVPAGTHPSLVPRWPRLHHGHVPIETLNFCSLWNALSGPIPLTKAEAFAASGMSDHTTGEVINLLHSVGLVYVAAREPHSRFGSAFAALWRLGVDKVDTPPIGSRTKRQRRALNKRYWANKVRRDAERAAVAQQVGRPALARLASIVSSPTPDRKAA